MYKVGIIEDELMIKQLLVERLSRGYGDVRVNVDTIEFEDKTIDEIVDIIYENNFDAVVIDHKLKSINSNITYEGTDIAYEIEKIIHFFPVFILTSYDLDAESKEYMDVHKIYRKDKYLEDENGDYVESINRRIISQIEHYKNRLNDAQQELLRLNKKVDLSAEEKEKLLELDHLVEKSMNGRKAVPLSLKAQDEKLTALINLAEELLKKSDQNVN